MENQQLFLEPQKIEVIGQTVSLKTRETVGYGDPYLTWRIPGAEVSMIKSINYNWQIAGSSA